MSAKPPSRSALALAALALLLALPRAAIAHARLVQSDPPKRAALAAPPRAIRLWFNEAVEPSFARVSVADSAGKRIESTALKVDPDDAKVLELSLPGLAAGAYTVSYEVLSVDGHRVKGSYSFTVKGSAGSR